MSTALHQLRYAWIVLATIFGASLVSSDAAACSMMARGETTCRSRSSCECCPPGAASGRAVGVDRATMGLAAVTPWAPAGCEAAPGGACVCRSHEPVAPTPKPSSRSLAEGRIELSPGSALLPPGDDSSSRIKLALRTPAVQSPPKAPLYLRNERLLF